MTVLTFYGYQLVNWWIEKKERRESTALDKGGDIYHCLFSTVLGAFGEVVALDLFFLDISFVLVYTQVS